MDFVHGIILVHQFRTDILERYLWILFQNPKNNSLFHKHDNTKNRFPRLCSKIWYEFRFDEGYRALLSIYERILTPSQLALVA